MGSDSITALQTIHLGNKVNPAFGQPGHNANQSVDSGFIIGGSYGTQDLIGATLGKGSFGFFDPSTWALVTSAPDTCCPLVIASASILSADKIGTFHGGYQESFKSKVIDPKRVSRFYRVDPCTANPSIIHVGSTAYTSDGGVLTVTVAGGLTDASYVNGTYTGVVMTSGAGTTGTGLIVTITIAANTITTAIVTNPGTGYVAADLLTIPAAVFGNVGAVTVGLTVGTVRAATTSCCKEFLCNQSYTLRVDVQGSPMMRYVGRNGYFHPATWTGCCPADEPTAIVDSTLVFIAWADSLLASVVVSPFLNIVVYDELGLPWYAPGTNGGVDEWDDYESPGHTDGACAGFTLTGAYTDTVFSNCTFYTSDYYERYPVEVKAQEMDFVGDTCTFEGLCVVKECAPRMATGFGETVLRDIIVTESYKTNRFYQGDDLRMREVTLGNDIRDSVSRSATYYRYYIEYTVAASGNPTSVSENTMYSVCIILDNEEPLLEAFLNDWLETCANCPALQEITCGADCPA
jgi:hypothetical protein